jgi:formylglycine-generating enzyme required for sulfatase activity
MKGYAGAQLSLMLYGVTGPYAELDAYLKLEADTAGDPWWTLYGGLEALGGVKMEVLGHSLADYESPSIIGYRLALAQAHTNTPPNLPFSPFPADDAVDQSVNVDLSWSGGDLDGDSVTYDVYFEADDSTPDVLVSDDQATLAYDPGTLSVNTQYYWRIVAKDEHGATKDGSVWSFVTGTSTNHPPRTPSSPSPPNGAIDQSVDVDLSWAGGDVNAGDTVTYDVYIGMVSPPTTFGCDDVTVESCDPGTLSYDTHYYWQVIATDEHGAMVSGPVWNFITGTEEPCSITLTLKSPQVADLTATISGTVTSDCSTITRLNWQWGDGTSDDQWFPASHTYAVSGTYPITVTAYNDLGDTEVAMTTAYVGTTSGEMVTVPAGEFQMGCDDSNPNENCYSDEQPLHTVYLDAYAIDKYEVTNAQYAEFLNAEGNQEEGGYTWLDADDLDVRIHESGGVWQADAGYEDHPVIEVTWYGARAYCQWQGKRLPTEAEWEKAARGSSDTRMYPWGNEDPDCSRLNYHDSTEGSCVGDTTPVGSYPSGASPYGALDMAGNVWEWVNDWYDSDYYDTSPYSNPSGPDSGDYRVLRGGGWYYLWLYVRVAARYGGYYPYLSGNYLGFRCVGVALGP